MTTTELAWEESTLGDHLDEYLAADDNEDNISIYSTMLGGVHIYSYPPSQILNRPFWTLVTVGASGTVMPVPDRVPDPENRRRAEFMCFLPPVWELPRFLPSPKTHKSWPLDMLRSLAGYVIHNDVWLSADHGISSLTGEQPGAPFAAGLKLSNLVILEAVMEQPGFSPCIVKGEKVNFFLCIPLTAAEAAWKRAVGIANSLYHVVGDKRECADVAIDFVINPQRACAVEDLHIPEKITELTRAMTIAQGYPPPPHQQQQAPPRYAGATQPPPGAYPHSSGAAPPGQAGGRPAGAGTPLLGPQYRQQPPPREPNCCVVLSRSMGRRKRRHTTGVPPQIERRHHGVCMFLANAE